MTTHGDPAAVAPPRSSRAPWVLVLWWLRRGVGLHLLATLGLVLGSLLAPLLGLAAGTSLLDTPATMLSWSLSSLPVITVGWLVFGTLAVGCHVLTRGSDGALVLAAGSCGAVVAMFATRVLDASWTPGLVPTLLVIAVVGVGFGTWSLFDRATLTQR